MGTYLNPESARFVEALDSEVFVDKTEMLAHLNSLVRTKQKYLSVSRPRRFGKTMAADMVCAYYGRSIDDAREMFEQLGIAQAPPTNTRRRELAWDAYLGSFDVVRLTMTEFLKDSEGVRDMLARMTEAVVAELAEAYPDAILGSRPDLLGAMRRAYAHTRVPFVIVVDEWDAPMRERAQDEDGQRLYLDFLRDWLKDQEFVALAYMTGILPIKKYGKHSALNMFDEYSMVAPLRLAPYTGFTEEEVRELCDEWGMPFDDVRAWYDGYEVSENVPRLVSEHPRRVRFERRDYAIYSPYSVVHALMNHEIRNWWNKTETYEALAAYIRKDYDGLKAAVALLMDGGRLKVDLGTYQNDMTTFHGRDDVLALLIHLGYLGWDDREGKVFVPNKEVMEEFRASTKTSEWEAPLREYEASKELLRATWDADEERVAALLEAAHDRTDNKTYNSEAALSYAVQLAYYAAQRYYTTVLELDSGKGYADIAYLPAPRHADLPALVVELKWNQSARTALDQIRDRRYGDRLAHYEGNILLVSVNYDRDARPGSEGYKHHSCRIERA